MSLNILREFLFWNKAEANVWPMKLLKHPFRKVCFTITKTLMSHHTVVLGFSVHLLLMNLDVKYLQQKLFRICPDPLPLNSTLRLLYTGLVRAGA